MTRTVLSRAMVSVAVVAVVVAFAAPAAMPAGPFQFYSVTPCRVVDTRNANGPTGGPILNSGVPRSFPITGLCGVPSSAKAAVLNVTVVFPSDTGFLSLWPYNTTMPLVSTINFSLGETALANGAIVPLTTDPNFNLNVVLGMAGAGSAHVILDVTGYFQ